MGHFARSPANPLCDLYAKDKITDHSIRSETNEGRLLPRATARFAAQVVAAAGRADELAAGDNQLAA
jgi:hypothetical protein